MWSQVQPQAQWGDLQWEGAQETKGKTWTGHITHEGLLGLTYRESRSSQLDKAVNCDCGQAENSLYGGGDKDYVCAGVRGQ